MSAQSTYAYKARDSTGSAISGTMVASSADEVGTRLRAEGKWVFDIEENPLSAAASLDETQLRRNEAAKRVRREDVIALAQQLSVMLETGVPLFEALDAFCKQAARREFKQVLGVVTENIQSGEALSSAMAKWPRVFPILMVSLMKASEASGTMATMLARVGDYLAREQRTLKQIRGAVRYPIFLMFTGLSVTIFLMIFVLPKFTKIYEQKAASLPKPTQIILGLGDFITTQYMWYGPPLVVAFVVALIFGRRPSGRTVIDWLRLHTPLIKTMYSNLYIARSARTMATLLAAGVNILDVIDICRGVTGNVYYSRLWDSMADDVREGRQISDTVAASALIPRNVASMIAAGERSGQLPEVMQKIADFAEEELDNAVRSVTSMIEPAMIIFLGVIIGGAALALLLPIFKMTQIMSG